MNIFRSEIYCLCRSDPQQTELIKSNSQKSPLLGTVTTARTENSENSDPTSPPISYY